MTKRLASSLAIVAALITGLYLAPLPWRGLVGPDEPRYASIARHMAESGDWVTPTLWGEPWFEKPAMLFWLGGLGRLAGLEDFVRTPVVLLCLAFLVFFWHRLRGEFGDSAALSATCLLATAAGWVAYADAAVFDAPVTVFVSAALLCLLPWIRDRGGTGLRGVTAFGALLGLGVLSKGLVAPIVASLALVPALFKRPRRALDLLGPRALVPFAAVCLPWYVACYWRNGRAFVDEFLVRHHWERFFSSSIEHVQPWWFFGPVVALFLLPWSPLLLSLGRDALWGGPRRRFLAAWALGSIAFFSVSVNKLPAYVLPALPPLAILIAVEWERVARRSLLLASACMLALAPLAGTLLPPALADGITRAWRGLAPGSLAAGLSAGVLAAFLAAMASRLAGRRLAIPAVAAVAAVALAMLKFQTYPAASRIAGTREFYGENRDRIDQACLGQVRRHVAYGLRHLSEGSLTGCDDLPKAYRIEGEPPRIASSESGPERPGTLP